MAASLLVLPWPSSGLAAPSGGRMSLALVPGQSAQTVTPGAPATVNGILQPPPDIKSIIDKTAQFVARNGPEFENRILCAARPA